MKGFITILKKNITSKELKNDNLERSMYIGMLYGKINDEINNKVS